jgi:hypothetical protein
MKDETLQILHKGISSKELPTNMSKTDCNYLQFLAQRLFQGKNSVGGVNDFNSPEWHFTYKKSTEKKPCVKHMTAFLVVTMRHRKHTLKFLLCTSDQRCSNPSKNTNISASDANNGKSLLTRKCLFLLLPIPKRPNFRIHTDLFGPMIMADGNKKICALLYLCSHKVCCCHCNCE